MPNRRDRVAEAIRQEVSLILLERLKDPRVGFVTITRAEMTDDLRFAKVYFSVLGKEEDCRKTKEALDSALGFIRSLVSERINLKFAPEIAFYEDRSSEHSVRIQQVLDEIKELEGKPLIEKAVKVKTKKGVRSGNKTSRRLHKKK